jgi:hypothetical protein
VGSALVAMRPARTLDELRLVNDPLIAETALFRVLKADKRVVTTLSCDEKRCMMGARSAAISWDTNELTSSPVPLKPPTATAHPAGIPSKPSDST